MKEELFPSGQSKSMCFSSRIEEDFCSECKYNKNDPNHPCFIPCNGICVKFEYASAKAKKEYENQVLRNQAITIWLEKGKSLEEIYKLPKDKLLSVLSKKHFEQFDKYFAQNKKDLERLNKEAIAAETAEPPKKGRKPQETSKGKVHYFYCKDSNSNDLTFHRDTTAPSYEFGVKMLRRKLEGKGIKIIKEEIK